MVAFKTWGREGIADNAVEQMETICEMDYVKSAALMADAHLGYSLPIGGVIACDNAVVPPAVGVDIACRLRLTLCATDAKEVELLSDIPGLRSVELARALGDGTKFGIGCNWAGEEHDHEVMDSPVWGMTEHLEGLKDNAWRQLGTSGSGNHFVEWGVVEASQTLAKALSILPGRYISLLSHSGSRGPGARTCQKYTKMAKKQNPAGELSWLDLDSDEGKEYWSAMGLMGEYAAANHECLHKRVLGLAGLKACGVVENHHNFAWKEDGLIIHRKGATPAHEGVLGIIPGSMASPGYIVQGKGDSDSLNSASHGAGRLMSRTQCKKTLEWSVAREDLKRKGIWLLDAGLDEVMGAYKDIDEVMACQRDLVETIGRFDPKIVLMDGDGSRAED